MVSQINNQAHPSDPHGASAQTGRYLVSIDSVSTNQLFTDCLVIGAGIAGLRAAIEAAERLKVIIVCKGALEDCNTWNAQGGIASVLDSEDTFDSHIADTLKTGCGLCDKDTVDLVIRRGPELVLQLLNWGAEFDRTDDRIAITLEVCIGRVLFQYGCVMALEAEGKLSRIQVNIICKRVFGHDHGSITCHGL